MKLIFTVMCFCIGVVLMPLLPFALAAFAWNEYDQGDYGDE